MGKKKDMEMDAEKEKKTCRHRQKKEKRFKETWIHKVSNSGSNNSLTVKYRHVQLHLGR